MTDLPEMAYAQNPSDDSAVIIIKRGEMGYWPFVDTRSPEAAAAMVERRNTALGVTAQQAEAMLMGSMFGWDAPIVRLTAEGRA